jgi:hypothetical protein
MKKISTKCLFTLFICFVFSAEVTAQMNPIKDLPTSFANEKDTILVLYKGDVMHVTIDSVYVLNKKRFDDVTKLMSYRDFMRNKDPMSKAFSTVWESQSQTLDSLEKYIALLKINADKTFATGEKLAENTIMIAKAADSKLDTVSQKLTLAQNKLDSANVHLDKAVSLIKTDMRWRWLKNAALVAIGVLLGYFAAK